MGVLNARAERFISRGNSAESPTDTYTIQSTNEQEIASGLDHIVLDINRDGSFILDITYTFLTENLASYFKTHECNVIFCGDYNVSSIFLPATNGSGVISDSFLFKDEASFNSFVNQIQNDLSLELDLPNEYYGQ